MTEGGFKEIFFRTVFQQRVVHGVRSDLEESESLRQKIRILKLVMRESHKETEQTCS